MGRERQEVVKESQPRQEEAEGRGPSAPSGGPLQPALSGTCTCPFSVFVRKTLGLVLGLRGAPGDTSFLMPDLILSVVFPTAGEAGGPSCGV